MATASTKRDLRLPSTRCAFVQRLSAALAENCGVEPRSRLVAGVSGGADSFALLAGLAALAKRKHLEYEVHAVYVHHHLRGEADEEAREVHARCGRLGIASEIADIRPAEQPGNLYANARRLRYEVLARVATRLGADAMVTAHHGDDLLETMLMRMARGAGGSGLRALAPMRWRCRMKGVMLIRPLLNQTHEDCTELLRSIEWTWFEDAGNRDERRSRNALRERLAGVLRPEERARTARRIHQTMEAAAEGDRTLRAKARQALRRARESGEGTYRRSEMAMERVQVACEMLRQGLQNAGAEWGSRHATVLAAVRAMRSPDRARRTIPMGDGWEVRISAKTVVIARSDEPRGKRRE